MKERQSNIELLRIIAMMLVVLGHANYFSIGPVSQSGIIANPYASFIRIILEQICIVGVDVFVLISGWFGLRPTLRGGCNLLFQVLFYVIIILLTALIIRIDIPQGYTKLRGFRGYWFISVYLVLYVIAPVLNAFVASSRPSNYLLLLLFFFSYETYYLLQGEALGVVFSYGLSVTHFMGLYLLAQFVRKYLKQKLPSNQYLYFGFFILFTLLPSLIAFVGIKYVGHDYFNGISNSSPFVIAASLSLLMTFDCISYNNKVVNWIACSVFAIYLIHMNPIVVPYFISFMKWGYASYGSMMYAVFAIATALVGGLVCVLIDKVRILLWRFSCYIFLDSLLERMQSLFRNCILRLGI